LQYVGESERAVRQVFSRARASSPCVIFFDELDALVPRRDEGLASHFSPSTSAVSLIFLFHTLSQSESSARVVNTLLTELDGLEARKSVYVIAATNRPDMIDPAMVRPGRLDKLLYVDLPTADERAEIVGTAALRVPMSTGTRDELKRLVSQRCDGYSGADLAALVREAGVIALKRTLGTLEDREEQIDVPMVSVSISDFEKASNKVGPSVSAAQRKKYEALRSKFAGLPVVVLGRVDEDKIAGERK
jgi:ribosome biogenesis ATPase